MADVSGVSNSSGSSATGTSSSKSIADMTGQDFLKLLISELSNQDPFEPMKNKEILEQLSAIRELESNINMTEKFNTLIDTQKLVSATSLVGKTVLGYEAGGDLIQGVVQCVVMDETGTYLAIGDYEMSLDKVVAITETAKETKSDETTPSNTTNTTEDTSNETTEETVEETAGV